MNDTGLGRSGLVVSRRALGTIETQPIAADISLIEIDIAAIDAAAARTVANPNGSTT